MALPSLREFIKNNLSDVSFYSSFDPKEFAISVDTRTLQKGDIFLALPGSTVHGHMYVAQALKQGACGIIVEHQHADVFKDINQDQRTSLLLISVNSCMSALTQLASAWRNQFNYPVIGITGSVGKTSTKELLFSIVNHHQLNYIASQGNQNTLIGVCLTIFRMRSDHQGAIFEVGVNKRGEMSNIIKILRPNLGIITAIGHAHMEGLGTIQDIANEKRMIFSLFEDCNIGVIFGDQPLLSNVSYPHPIIRFGAKTTNQVQARKVCVNKDSIQFILKLYGQKFNVTIPSGHMGALYNSLAAIAMAYHLEIPTNIILEALEKPLIVRGRFEHRSLNFKPGILINDCYNSNPESMKASILAFQKFSTSAQKIAVLGDMAELGHNGPFWHRQLGRFLRKAPSIQRIILVGSMVQWMKKTIPITISVEHVATWQDAEKILKNSINNDAVVLIKGSRALGLDNLVDSLSK